eukprot:m51a1_g8515 putative nucleolar gtp-binding protein 2 (703) ;mRNA; r:86978-89558
MTKAAPRNKQAGSVSKGGTAAQKSRGGTNRTAATQRRLDMYKTRAKRDAQGKVIKEMDYQSKALPSARIQPDRGWFGNTQTVGQKQLQTFRSELGKATANPYSVLLRARKLPWSLLNDPAANSAADPDGIKSHLLQVEGYQQTFGPGATRKRPKLGAATDLEGLARAAAEASERYDEGRDQQRNTKQEAEAQLERQRLFDKGQSHRIWGELWKVVDSSDVIVEVLDARDPMGTRCTRVEQLVREKMRHKHIVLLLNKCDLIPTWATARWVQALSREYPTLAYHASITNPFGKGALIQLLRQYSALHKDNAQISVGFVGYPNVGKSSVINALVGKKSCGVAPIPGMTKVWQYITLMKRIFLIDCPGVVYPVGDTEDQTVLKGVVRVEAIQDAETHIPAVLARVKREYMQRTYGVEDWTDHMDFLMKLAVRKGRLLKKGEPDVETVAKMILSDWQRGKIPFFTPPPMLPGAAPLAPKDEPPATPALPTTAAATAETQQQQQQQQQPAEPKAEQQADEDAGAEAEAEGKEGEEPELQEPKIEQQDFREIQVAMKFSSRDMVDPEARRKKKRAPAVLKDVVSSDESDAEAEADNDAVKSEQSDDDDDTAAAAEQPAKRYRRTPRRRPQLVMTVTYHTPQAVVAAAEEEQRKAQAAKKQQQQTEATSNTDKKGKKSSKKAAKAPKSEPIDIDEDEPLEWEEVIENMD